MSLALVGLVVSRLLALIKSNASRFRGVISPPILVSRQLNPRLRAAEVWQEPGVHHR